MCSSLTLDPVWQTGTLQSRTPLPDTVLGIDGSTADAVAASIRNAIEEARDEYGLDVSADVTETGSVVTLTNSGPLVRIEGFGTYDTRVDARLQIDPGIVVKMWDSRIEMEMGSQLIAEGRVGSDEGPGYTVVFTSFLDDRYGAAGTFDTGEIANQDRAEPGDWGGLYFAPVSTGSIDQAILAWGGGDTRIEGDRASFNTVKCGRRRFGLPTRGSRTTRRFRLRAIGMDADQVMPQRSRCAAPSR